MQITSHTGGKANLRSKGAAESLSNMRWMLDDKDKVAVHKLGGGTQVENDFILKKLMMLAVNLKTKNLLLKI